MICCCSAKKALVAGAVPAALAAVVCGVIQQLLSQPDNAKTAVYQLASVAGVPESIFDQMEVLDDSVWYDIITKGNLGIAEAYMNGKLNLDPLPFFYKLFNGTAPGTQRHEAPAAFRLFGDTIGLTKRLATTLFNDQSQGGRSMRVIEQHYNSGNDVYEGILGRTMGYTCGYWRNASTLEESQEHKLDLVRRKMQLEPGMRVAELGMGWGFGMSHIQKAAPKGVTITGVTLSTEQLEFAKERFGSQEGLRFVRQDYRDHCLDPEFVGSYDRIYSIGMLEHVGPHNYKNFFRCVRSLLKPDGLAVVHTIGEPDSLPAMDPFLDKYIFPGAVIPSLSGVSTSFEDLFILEDLQNFGHDYAATLAAWTQRAKVFFAADGPKKHDISFQRMWFYYLAMCEALFELRVNQLWQFVLSPRPTIRKTIDRQV